MDELAKLTQERDKAIRERNNERAFARNWQDIARMRECEYDNLALQVSTLRQERDAYKRGMGAMMDCSNKLLVERDEARQVARHYYQRCQELEREG